MNRGSEIVAEEMKEEVHITRTDLEFCGVEDLGDLLKEYTEEENSLRNNKYVRGGIRTAGSMVGATVAATATTWAVTNFWNPTGWVAGLVAVGAAALGGAVTEYGSRKVTDWMERTGRRELTKKRAEIVIALKERNLEHRNDAQNKCRIWLEEMKDFYQHSTTEITKPICSTAESISNSIHDMLNFMKKISREMDDALVREMTAMVVPELREGRLSITGIAREPGYRLCLSVASEYDYRGNYMSPFIGYEGVVVKQLKDLMGGERISIVDSNAPFKRQIIQALGLKNVSENQISIHHTHKGKKEVTVHVAKHKIGRAVGSNGTNARAAGKLLNCYIKLESKE